VSQSTEPPRFVTLPEIRRAAKARLPLEAWNFGDGGAETERTLRRNRRHLDRLAIQQNVLVDVRAIDLRTSLLGVPLSWPVAVAPMGGLVLFHAEGDVEMARGSGQADTLQWLSGATGWPVEDVAKAGKAPQMFQLYHHGDRGWVKELLARVEASGYLAVALTVDAVGDRADIVVDGGFARGTDVVKAVARGAKVVAVGRTALWGLAADGAAGVARVFEILREEIRTTMGLSGRTKIADLTPDLIFRVD